MTSPVHRVNEMRAFMEGPGTNRSSVGRHGAVVVGGGVESVGDGASVRRLEDGPEDGLGGGDALAEARGVATHALPVAAAGGARRKAPRYQRPHAFQSRRERHRPQPEPTTRHSSRRQNVACNDYHGRCSLMVVLRNSVKLGKPDQNGYLDCRKPSKSR